LRPGLLIPQWQALDCMIGFDALLVRDPDSIFLAVLGAGRRAVTLYLAIFDNVLHRLRFAKFLSVSRADIPEVLTWIWFWFMHVLGHLCMC
jgi:hypothetical protein